MLIQVSKSTDATEFVSLTSMKSHLRVDVDTDDVMITEMMQHAVDEIERDTATDYHSSTWDEFYTSFAGVTDRITLTNMPLVSVTYIKYYDVDNVLQTLNSANYYVAKPTNLRGWVVPVYNQSWPSAIKSRDDAVVIRYVTGGTDNETFKHLLKLKVEEMYDGKDYAQTIERMLNLLRSQSYH